MDSNDHLNKLNQKRKQLVDRNRNLDIDPVIGFQAEHTMIRIERRINSGLRQITHCATCGEKIPKKRLNVCPETIWCVDCVEIYDELKGRKWKKRAA